MASEATQTPEKSWLSKNFLNFAVKRFDADTVVNFLAMPHDPVAGRRQVLTAGFCTWVVRPYDKRLIKSSLAVTAAIGLNAAEKKTRDADPTLALLREFVFRTKPGPIAFFEKVYHPLGGLEAILNAPSPRDFRVAISADVNGLKNALNILAILHYHVENLKDLNRYGEPSLIVASKLVKDVNPFQAETPVKSRQALTHWARYKVTLPYAYAAAQLTTADGLSLLDRLLTGRARYKFLKPLMHVWFPRARYLFEEIVSKMPEREGHLRKMPFPSWLEAEKVAPLELSEIEIGAIRAGYDRKKPLASRAG